MSSILHPFHSASQKCRPKHQVLVLKCYPKYQKNVQEVHANASELSYLLYYASTRRSKLQKVGAFLEKKTASDVYRGKLGNVQVTFQILTAIIEKAPHDLSLYSRSVMTILDCVLRSKDINMVEESVPAFEAYCKHVDAASLTADQHRAQQYLSILELYAAFATKNQGGRGKAGDSIPLSLRWRTAGLRAIRAAVASEALAADSARQLNIVIPVILENMSLEEDNMLATLQQRVQTIEKLDDESARRRRMSIATVTTVDTVDGNPATAVETTAGADKVAEEEVRALALRCLKQIFSVSIGSTRGQTRLATALTLKYITSKNPPRAMPEGDRQGNWATSLFEAIARWTPVQDRFIIVVTAMEALVRSPIIETLLERQLVLAIMIDWLLSSNINLIGLSVMDVLLGFIHHTLLLLQLGGRDSKVLPHHQQTHTLGFYREARDAFDPSTVLAPPESGRQAVPTTEAKPSPIRQELLCRLRKCIASLSNHIYYTDQIADMMTAILARLKPSSQSEVPTAAAAVNDPEAATKAILESGSLQEDATTDSFFSFTTARILALRAIKDILVRVNGRRSASGGQIEARARVGIQVWEGTQWLLKDEDREGRLAYVDSLLTWLRLETNKNDMLLPRDGPRKALSHGKKNAGQNGEAALAKRAVSSASKKEPKLAKSNFLQLLHLAIYDSILDQAEHEADMLLLYLLLTKLVDRLGVNALRTGLPMMIRLQQTTLNGEVVSARARVHVASVVHGYLWSIAERFDFEASKVGHEINAEISRRKKLAVWFEQIKFPALSIDHIRTTLASDEKAPSYAEEAVDTIKPFLNVAELVDEIATAYDKAHLTPPGSPPGSPGRVFSVPTLGFGYGYGIAPVPRQSRENHMPQKTKDEMASRWTRESCIAALEKETTVSMTGSRTGASSGPIQHLGLMANGTNKNGGSGSGRESPVTANGEPSPAFGLFGGLGSIRKQRRFSTTGSPAQLTPTSSRDSTVRVKDLKRALSGYAGSMRHPSPLRRPPTSSRRSSPTSASESMVSWNEADDHNASMIDIEAGPAPNGIADDTTVAATTATGADTEPFPQKLETMEKPQDNEAIPSASHDQTTLPGPMSDPRLGNDVPPVPRIPSTLNLPGTWPRDASPVRPRAAANLDRGSQSQTDDVGASPRSQRISSSSAYAASSVREKQSRKMTSRPTSRKGAGEKQGGATEKLDVGSLLAAIRSGVEVEDVVAEKTLRLGQPPY